MATIVCHLTPASKLYLNSVGQFLALIGGEENLSLVEVVCVSDEELHVQTKGD